MEKLDKSAGQSMDIVADNIAKLKELFPEILTENKIDFKVLQTLLGEEIETDDERYSFNWHGKVQARRLAQSPSTGTLRPSKEESVNWDITQNMFIEGDNLEVLKLLQKSYHKQVKMIYIDPPYNTGKDFVYPDNFRDNIQNYLELTGQVDNGNKITTNTEANGRFHTDWLNMMYPRLKLSQNLLRRDGVMFVSCDEGEQARLRAIMDEIFGQENFVADMVWAAGRKNDSRLISVSHEYIVCYARDKGYLTEQKVEWRQRKKGLEEIYAQYAKIKRSHGTDYSAMTAAMKEWFKGLSDNHPSKAHKHYSNIDARGVYFPDNISWPGGGGPKYEVLHPKTGKPVSIPSRGWMTSDPDKLQLWINEDRVHFGIDESSVPCIKSYLKDREYQTPYSVFYQDGRAATKRLRELMGGDFFDFPKDETVIQELIEMTTSANDIIVDCFAGSGTTGHALWAQNTIDNFSRRYILVQLPEKLNSEKTEQKASADFCELINKSKTIAEITKERLRRASKKIKDENPDYQGDLGFKVFKLDSSNLKPWDADFDSLAQDLADATDVVKVDRKTEDVLFEILLKYGLDLTLPIDAHSIASKTVYEVGAGALIVCLDDGVTEAVAEGIGKLKEQLEPEVMRVVFKDSSFASDAIKVNAMQVLKQYGIDDVKSI